MKTIALTVVVNDETDIFEVSENLQADGEIGGASFDADDDGVIVFESVDDLIESENENLWEDAKKWVLTDLDPASGANKWVIVTKWNTDADGRDIDPEQERCPTTIHGPYPSEDAARQAMEDRPDDTEVHDMWIQPLNDRSI